MSDWKESLRNGPGKASGSGTPKRICAQCKKEFVPLEQHHRFCSACIRERRQTTAPIEEKGQAPSRTRLLPDYLKGGYFDDNRQLRAGIFKEDAKVVADSLAGKMSGTALRAFYNKLKAIESKYKTSGNNFDLIRPVLFAFERDVAYQVSRQVVPEDFRTFINVNAEIAARGPEEFKGFVEHFFSVLAYFKDYSKSS